jgi:dihydropteroate synthase
MDVVTPILRSRHRLPGGRAVGHDPAQASSPPLPGGTTWELAWAGTAVMGVVNVTPDSFSGGSFPDPRAAIDHARRLADEGALVVDVGGESTRPGSEAVPLDVELARVLPVVAALAASHDVVISVDTRKPDVARRAVAAGAHLVNDVGGLRDPAMLEAVADVGVPVVVMHMQGEPATMQRNPTYVDVVAEVRDELHRRARQALVAGVPSVMVDPGIGFGKRTEHNLALLRALPELAPYPVLVGASRKGLVNALADVPSPGDRLPGSLAIHLWAALHGAAMVRVHDVGAHVQALRVLDALRGRGPEAPRG